MRAKIESGMSRRPDGVHTAMYKILRNWPPSSSKNDPLLTKTVKMADNRFAPRNPQDPLP